MRYSRFAVVHLALARADHLPLLQYLYKEILIPLAVYAELCLESGRPGSKRLAGAIVEGWLVMSVCADDNPRLIAAD